jgi:cation:H+ antiporter
VLVIWIVGLRLVSGPGSRLPWTDSGEAPDSQAEARGHSQAKNEQQMTQRGVSTTRAALVFGTAALLTLVAGVALERSGEQAFGNLGLTGVLFGSTVLAAATSLPELSTGLASARSGDAKLAMSDIFGGNAFLPVLFVLVPLISDEAVLPSAQASDIYLTALGVVLTVVYAVGLIFRPRRHVLRMGLDSLCVLVLYALGVVGLVLLS